MKLVPAALILLAFVAMGLAGASDFRGFARDFAKQSLASARPGTVLLRRHQTSAALPLPAHAPGDRAVREL